MTELDDIVEKDPGSMIIVNRQEYNIHLDYTTIPEWLIANKVSCKKKRE